MRALIVLAALCAAPAPAPAKLVERVVAVVNDDIILESEIQAAAAEQRSPEGDPFAGMKPEEMRRKVVDRLIDSTLIKQQAKELKLQVTAEEIERGLEELRKQSGMSESQFTQAVAMQGFSMDSLKKNVKRQILEMKVINTAVRSRVSPASDDEVQAYYNQNVAKMSGDSEAKLRMVLVQCDADAPKADAERREKTAQKVAELVREGKSFAELAKKYSDDELTKAEGGDLGWVAKGMLVDELDAVIGTMQTGDVRGPIRTPRGFHVLQLVERRAANVKSFAAAKEDIRRQLSEQQLEKSMQSWLRDLRKRAHVETRL